MGFAFILLLFLHIEEDCCDRPLITGSTAPSEFTLHSTADVTRKTALSEFALHSTADVTRKTSRCAVALRNGLVGGALLRVLKHIDSDYALSINIITSAGISPSFRYFDKPFPYGIYMYIFRLLEEHLTANYLFRMISFLPELMNASLVPASIKESQLVD